MILEKLFSMTSGSGPVMCCPNPECDRPRNPLGRMECEACQTPLIYRYLWAVGPEAEQIPAGTLVRDRYQVISPQIWLDTKPGDDPDAPSEVPDELISYLYLYPYRLHTPELYGFCAVGEGSQHTNISLLENVPIDGSGRLYPSLLEVWTSTSEVRQVYWLWQLWQLWEPLSSQGVGSSLLISDNIRVEGSRLRLLELYGPNHQLKLQDLADFWAPLVETAGSHIRDNLQEIYGFLCHPDANKETNKNAIRSQLNQLLLTQASQLPLHLTVAGVSDTGPQREHNEDTCYPTTNDGVHDSPSPNHPLLPYFAIVCDGVGGHEGGEVASQLAVQSLKPLIQTLLRELSLITELITPEMVSKQLEEIVRVVNNVICAQNNQQSRELRQRMGTTLVMALQLPQSCQTAEGKVYQNCHELYLVNVGDSRAYWITEEHCQRLTIDDDVATREVRMGRSLYWQGLKRLDGGALTQALGTREGEYVYPSIQRVILEEDGLLLLCSDGLSDNDWVEHSWALYAPAVLRGEMSLESALQFWVNLANTKNGHDNTSIVLTHCRVSPEKLVLFPSQVSSETPIESELSEASKALLYGEPVPVPKGSSPRKSMPWKPILYGLGFFTLLVLGIAVGWGWQNLREISPSPELPKTPEPPKPQVPPQPPDAPKLPSSKK